MLHYLIKKSLFQNERILLFAEDQLNENEDKKMYSTEDVKSKKKNNVIKPTERVHPKKTSLRFYIIYLLKYMMHSKAYLTAK